MGRFPDLNPITFPHVLCAQCGRDMAATPERDPKGGVTSIKYTCVNPDVGCAYFIRHDQRLNGMTHPVKA